MLASIDDRRTRFERHTSWESRVAYCKCENVSIKKLSQRKHNIHESTKLWESLSELMRHLGRSGIARVDETEKGRFLAWIDSSPQALVKQEASMKKERVMTLDEIREQPLIHV